RDQRDAQGPQQRRRGSDPGAAVPQGPARRDGPPQGLARARLALHQRRLLGRREEARRDPADGDAEAAHRRPRRDRLGSRHRRAQGRRRRGERARQPGDGRARDHPLQADSELHPAGRRPRVRGREDREVGRARARRPARGVRLRGMGPRHERQRRGSDRRGGRLMAQIEDERLAGGADEPDENEIVREIGSDYAAKYGFHTSDEAEDYFFKSGRGLSRELVEAISEHKHEPEWMRKFRLQSLEYFENRPLPTWGGDVSGIDFDNIYYYIKPTEKQAESWEDLPADIKDTWDKLGIPEAEKKYLAGVGAQYESEVVYHKVQEDLAKQGVIFLDMDSGLREHEELVK